MDAVMDTPAIATVDAPRRRDEVLPEHEERWPATLAVEDVIAERYDGTTATAHEIGLELVTVQHGCYPGWRVEQIAQGMGIARQKRDAIIAKVRAEDEAGKAARSSTAHLATTNPRPANTPTCEICGQTFEPWKTGAGFNRKSCRACFGAKARAKRLERIGKTTAPEPEPVYVAGPNFPTEILTAPGYVAQGLAQSGAIRELLDLLPATGRWSGKRRYRWLTAFTATLDLLIDDDRDESEAE